MKYQMKDKEKIRNDVRECKREEKMNKLLDCK